MDIIVVSLLSTVLFGLIDSTFFLFLEEDLQDYLARMFHFDQIDVALITGALSAAISIFFATYLRERLKRDYPILEHPLVDAVGILIGALVVILGKKMYERKKLKAF